MTNKLYIPAICVAILLLQAPRLRAQTTPNLLGDVTVTDSRYNDFTIGQKTISIDSATLEQYHNKTIAELIGQQTTIYIKQTAPGILATTAFRGTSSQQTGFYWQGLPVNSPSLGLTDLSVLPVGLFDKISVYSGGGSSLYGSGSIGGSILLENRPSFSKGTEIVFGQAMGSYGLSQTHFSGGYSNKIIYTRSAYTYRFTENNYDYTYARPNLTEERKLKNANSLQHIFLQDVGYRLTNKDVISFHYWHQQSDREIPNAITARDGTAEQYDRSNRAVLQFQHAYENGFLKAKLAYFDELQVFDDPAIFTDDSTNTRAYISELQYEHGFSNKTRLNAGFTASFYEAFGSNLKGADQYQGALFAAVKHQVYKTLNAKLAIRQEFVQDVNVPITPSLGAEWAIVKHVILKGNVAYNYRVPTLNDRFWSPGGNPDLKPESGWTEEVGILLSPIKTKSNTLTLEFTGYHSEIENWIQWVNVGTFFSPRNIKKVETKGFEASLNYSYTLKKVRLQLGANYGFTESITKEVELASDNSLGQQLIFVPKHTGNAQLHVAYGNASIFYNHTVVGEAYDASDNNENSIIDSYNIASLGLSYTQKYNKLSIGISAQVNNIWDRDYVVIRFRPMPRRNFLIGITIKFLNTNKASI